MTFQQSTQLVQPKLSKISMIEGLLLKGTYSNLDKRCYLSGHVKFVINHIQQFTDN